MQSVSLLPCRHLDKAWIVCISAASLPVSAGYLEAGQGIDLRPLFSSFPPLPDPHMWKCSFRSTLALQGLNIWANVCWAILANHVTACLKCLSSETTCTGTVLLYILPEQTVKMFLTHLAMEKIRTGKRCFLQLLIAWVAQAEYF